MSKLLFSMKQKFSMAEKTVDPVFEEARRSLTALVAELVSVHEAVMQAECSLRDSSTALTNLARRTQTLIGAGKVPSNEAFDLPPAISALSSACGALTTPRVERMHKLTGDVAEFMGKAQMCKSRMEQRDAALKDFDRYTDSLNGTKELAKQAELRSKVASARNKYETINSAIIQETTQLRETAVVMLWPLICQILQEQREAHTELAQAYAQNPMPDMSGLAAALDRNRAEEQRRAAEDAAAMQPAAYEEPAAAPLPPCPARHHAPPPPPPSDDHDAAPPPPPSRSHRSPPPAPYSPVPVPVPAPVAAPAHEQQTTPFDDDDAPPPPSKPLPKPGATLSMAPPAAGRAGDAEIETAACKMAGDAVASAATDERNQQRAGAAVAGAATDEANQQRMGSAIAARSDNAFVRGLAQNSAVQHGAGRAVGAVATNRTVQQRAGQAVATQAQDEGNQQKALGSVKGAFR
eukprot:m51a1_g9034 hypothetical protein (464) ;mRNA; f:235883-238003